MTDYATIKNLLNRPVAFHRVFADLAGGATSGLFLSQLWYWHDKTKNPEGWLFKTYEEWKEETCLSRSEIDRARKALKDLGILEEKKEGIPLRLFYRLDVDKLLLLIAESSKQGCKPNEVKFARSSKQECRILQTVTQDSANSNAGSDKHIYKDPEITTETILIDPTGKGEISFLPEPSQPSVGIETFSIPSTSSSVTGVDPRPAARVKSTINVANNSPDELPSSHAAIAILGEEWEGFVSWLVAQSREWTAYGVCQNDRARALKIKRSYLVGLHEKGQLQNRCMEYLESFAPIATSALPQGELNVLFEQIDLEYKKDPAKARKMAGSHWNKFLSWRK